MRFSFSFLVVLFIFISACGQPPRRPEPDNLFWPLPPETPRIKYLQSIYTDDDIDHVYSIRELLFGKAYNDRMTRPYGIFARKGKIYAADVVIGRVILFDRNEKNMYVFGHEGAMGTPADAVSDASGTVYVADSGQNKIGLYDARGKYKTAFPLGDARPVSLALNESLGRLYVVDRSGHRVMVFSLSGNLLFQFGSRGIDKGQFNAPLSIALDNSGNLYVLDAGNFRVQIFDPDGKFIRSFGDVGDRSGFFPTRRGSRLIPKTIFMSLTPHSATSRYSITKGIFCLMWAASVSGPANCIFPLIYQSMRMILSTLPTS